MDTLISSICLFGFVVIGIFVLFARTVIVVQQYERLVVFRLGKALPARKSLIAGSGPGLVILIPFIDRARRVDLREQVREVPHQTAITKDNAAISIDFIWYFQVIDPAASVLNVNNFEASAAGIATTTLRAVIGSITLDEALSERERINLLLRTRLDEVTERWGVKVTNVEIREIVPPREIQDAMNKQMSAERIRRAVVTESQGQREAAINVAEGEKQAAILRAEGEKQSAILRAQGEREAQILRAEGYARALESIFGVAQTIDKNTMTLQYFETLKSMGQGASTKYIFPMEFTSLLQSFAERNE